MKWFDEAFNEEIHTVFHQVAGAEHDVIWEMAIWDESVSC